MGVVQGSTWFSVPAGQRIQDSGWVGTNVPWVPVPLVNGYYSGQLTVTAEAGGYRESPLFSTVCRYGSASGGPHCGQILAKNQEVTPYEECQDEVIGGCPEEIIQGTTKTNICADRGDSGGPYISATGHAQGTAVAGEACAASGNSWFQPVTDSIDEFGLTLLTIHGTNPPDITEFYCPDFGNSGGGSYDCQMNYDTQGDTTIQWTTNTGHSSDEEWLLGTCGLHQTVNVSLTVTNAWGVDTQSTSFTCPMGPPQ